MASGQEAHDGPTPLSEPAPGAPGAGTLDAKLPPDPDVAKVVAQGQLTVTILGLIFGTICVIAGVILFALGVTGSTSWTTALFGGENKVADAAPGTILFVAGIYAIRVTRYKIT